MDAKQNVERPRASRQSPSIQSEIIAKSRPYIVEIGKDGVVGGSFYVLLVLFDVLLWILPVHGWEGEFFHYIHAVAVLAMLSVFAWMSIIDIYLLHKRERI